jgi:Flp pilus assembly protein TadD
LREARAFTHADHDILLVTRLDGYTVADAMALVDRAAAAAEGARAGKGNVVLDMKAALDDRGNAWLKAAADRLGEMGLADRVTLETTSQVVRDQADVLGYYCWGSNDPAIKDRDLGLQFLPGAIAGQFASTDGRTFREPPATWRPGTWEQRDTYHAGSPQSLAGDLIRQGVTGLSAHVAEPYLDATIRPDILFPAYLSGFTLGEAFYLAMPSLSWQTVIAGDPLATVATLKGRPQGDALEGAPDPATELPAYFSKRRLESLNAPAAKPEAVKAWLKALGREARGDGPGARKALEEAASADPSLPGPLLMLGQLLERDGEHSAAIARYRQVLALNGNNIVALNNLAYSLAVHEKKPADALPLAERAYTLSRGDANVADTLAWVHHRLGNKTQSGRYIAEALRGAGENGEIRLHAAAILLEAGELEGARRELTRALELEPALEQRQAELVRGVRERVK